MYIKSNPFPWYAIAPAIECRDLMIFMHSLQVTFAIRSRALLHASFCSFAIRKASLAIPGFRDKMRSLRICVLSSKDRPSILFQEGRSALYEVSHASSRLHALSNSMAGS